MKTIKFLLMLALPLVFLSSCSDSDEIPDVTINAELSGYYKVPSSQTIYLTPECNFTVESMSIISNDGKPASLGNVVYAVNGENFFITAIPPYTTKVPMRLFMEGDNIFTIQMTIIVEGYSPNDAQAWFNVVLVEDEASLPAGAVYVPTSSETDDSATTD